VQLELIPMTNRELLLQELQSISEPMVERVLTFLRQLQAPDASLLPTSEGTFDAQATPIWQLAAQASALVSDADWQKLPPDLAKNFDAYQQRAAD
jgi:hypothetical protein